MHNMKILVTGLCLQGNKGGAALALSLKDQLSTYIDDLDICFAVAPGPSYLQEKIWAQKYNVNVAKRFVYADILSLSAIKEFRKRITQMGDWFRLLKKYDLIVDLSALSYVGPPVAGNRKIYKNSRFSYFLSSLLVRKIFLAWTQSYGPFSTPLLRFMAKWDLKRQPIIFCRGESSLNAVKKLLPRKKAISFPDVATTLNYSHEDGKAYINQSFDNIDFNKLITISPSAVIFSRSKNNNGLNHHIKEIVELLKIIIAKGYTVILVPHTFRAGQTSPERCDSKICDLIVENFPANNNIYSINEDLSVSMLKSIISTAYIHIGARYHSLVAALSSFVPSIALSWHPKYKDIMEQYGLNKYVYSRDNATINNLIDLFNEIERNRDALKNALSKKQQEIESDVKKNAAMFVQLMEASNNAL